eukprot:31121-Pelagococcus_subviridis.AAC.6
MGITGSPSAPSKGGGSDRSLRSVATSSSSSVVVPPREARRPLRISASVGLNRVRSVIFDPPNSASCSGHHLLVHEPVRELRLTVPTPRRRAVERHRRGVKPRGGLEARAHHAEVRLPPPRREVSGHARGEHRRRQRLVAGVAIHDRVRLELFLRAVPQVARVHEPGADELVQELRAQRRDGLQALDAEGRARVRTKRQTDVGVELKGVRGGVERRRGVSSGLKPARGGRRETPGEKVLKDRRSQRERGRTGTSAVIERA